MPYYTHMLLPWGGVLFCPILQKVWMLFAYISEEGAMMKR